MVCVATGALFGAYKGGRKDVSWYSSDRQERKNDNIFNGMAEGSFCGACVAIAGPYALWLPVVFLYYSVVFHGVNIITPKPKPDRY